MDFELCIDSIEECQMAADYGLKRVELCSALGMGGLTPSLGQIEACSALREVEVHVMIRPRPGDFIYSKSDYEVMKKDIGAAGNAGANGVVFGVLNEKAVLDMSKNTSLLDLAKSLGMEVTFHRAFDFTSDAPSALRKLIDIGFDRVLTSGQKPLAIDGVTLITELVRQAKGEIQIMAGSGINGNNAKTLADTGIDALHFTSRKKQQSTMNLNMGDNFEPDSEKLELILEAVAD